MIDTGTLLSLMHYACLQTLEMCVPCMHCTMSDTYCKQLTHQQLAALVMIH